MINRTVRKNLSLQTLALKRNIEFDQDADTRFAEGAKIQTAWKDEPGDLTAQ